MTTVKVRFQWTNYRPDKRQYKQQSLEVEPTMLNGEYPWVEIDLPANLLANAEEFISAPIEGKPEPTPILSVAAVKYLVDEWEKVFSDVSPDDFKPAIDPQDFATEEEWNDESDPPTNPLPETTDNDNWDEVDKSTQTPEEKWDETTEDWGTESIDNS